MATEYVKKANKTAATGESETQETVARCEGMEGHAGTGDVRLAKYYPNEKFLLDISLH